MKIRLLLCVALLAAGCLLPLTGCQPAPPPAPGSPAPADSGTTG